MYDFDRLQDRRYTGAEKWNEVLKEKSFGDKDWLVPFTTADMEFKTCPAVIHALEKRAAHGLFGYTKPDAYFFHSIKGWLKRRHLHSIEEEEIICTQSVVPALMAAIRACTREEDGVITLTPAYTGFYTAVKRTGRQMTESPLLFREGRWHIDFEDFDEKIRTQHVRAFLLCNPHNPTGRVFTKGELLRLAEICLNNRVLVISDEIHADLLLKKEHIMYRSLSEECRKYSITCMSPAKTFNLAGLQLAYTLIAPEKLRERYRDVLKSSGHVEAVSAFGYTALSAAYREGEEWLEELLAYLRENEECLIHALAGTPVELAPVEGTYLAWLGFRHFGLSQEELLSRTRESGLYLTDGRYFGPAGEGFLRMNFAVPLRELRKGTERLTSLFAG